MEKILETERLSLHEVQVEDAPFILELLNTPGWLKYIGDRGVDSLASAQTYIEEKLQFGYRKFGYGLNKVCSKTSGEPIGLCGFLRRNELDAPDLGYALLPAHEGKGLASEAVKACLNWGKDHFEMTKIYAIVLPENQRSNMLLQRHGFLIDGVIELEGKRLQRYVLNQV